MMIDTNPQRINTLLTDSARVTEEIISIDVLKERLSSGKQLVLKYGVDLTAPDLHIGHAVNLWMYRAFQELGHKVIFLLGDFTTSIGDPTDRDQARARLSKDEIEENAKAIEQEVLAILRTDDAVLEVRRNSEWYAKMTAGELLSLLSMVTHDRLIGRDMFRSRQERGATIYTHELIYPVLQGYDSVMLESDLTVIGTDQLYNEMLGRWLQERFGQPPQVVMTTKITPGLDGGEKQSKSLGNYIGLSHTARDKFARAMRLRDDLLRDYLEVYTDLSMAQIDQILQQQKGDPMGAKLAFAEALVARYHTAAVGKEERHWFERTFRQRKDPDDMPVLRVPAGPQRAIDVLSAVPTLRAASNSQLRRLLQGGGVRVDSEKLSGDPYREIKIGHEGVVLRIGKTQWYRLIPK